MEFQEYGRGEKFEEEKEETVPDEAAERVTEMYDSLAEKLSDDSRKKLGPIIKLIDNSYDPENEEWAEFLTDVDFLLSEFEDVADDEEREQAQLDAQDELDHLVIRSQKLGK